jgi:2-polyprenyl-6-hydroxyphenyl methylase / 3-demethylubiquinone-9 3-methyltransferase
MNQSSANIDPNEIAKFEALASRWWDTSSEFKPLHEINPLRLSFILQYTELKGKSVIDIGCGGGILAESLARSEATVTAIDMGEAPLQVAKLHLLESQLEVDYQQATAEDFADKHAGKFDVVTCMEMLEHVPDPASVIDACSRLLKPNGLAFFSTINRNPRSYAFAIIGAEYVLRLLPTGTHDYDKFIKPSELGQWARQTGLNMTNLAGITYNPFNKAYSLSKDVDINYLVCTRK